MLILILLITLLISNAAPSAAANNGWVIEQTRTLSGKARVYTSDHGRRFANIDAGYELVSSAPDWNVYMCNDRKKLYFPMVVGKELKARSLSLGLLHGYVLNNADLIKWVKIRSTRYMGHPVDVWRGFYDGSKTGTNGKSGPGFAYTVEFWVASDVSLAPQITAAYHVLLGWPKNVYYLPLRCIRIGKSGSKSTLLETQSFTAGCNSSDLFQVPKGYKLAHNEMDVIMNMDNMDEFLEGLGAQHKKAQAGSTAK